MFYGIIITMGSIFVITGCFMLGFSTKITRPINELTKFTGRLTSATDTKEKYDRILIM
jgi:hypothetical protein